MSVDPADAPFPDVLGALALVVAPSLLGGTITGRGVTVRITEVEAYLGDVDPGSHAFRGVRSANRHLFGPPGTLYAYRSYGIHTCMNVVSGPVGVASGSLLRGGEVVAGVEVARSRRGQRVTDRGLARGPGNLGQALGAELADGGTSLLDGSGPFVLRLPITPIAAADVGSGPRTGIRGLAGGAGFPWRFWLRGDPTVSAYRRHPQALD